MLILLFLSTINFFAKNSWILLFEHFNFLICFIYRIYSSFCSHCSNLHWANFAQNSSIFVRVLWYNGIIKLVYTEDLKSAFGSFFSCERSDEHEIRFIETMQFQQKQGQPDRLYESILSKRSIDTTISSEYRWQSEFSVWR